MVHGIGRITGVHNKKIEDEIVSGFESLIKSVVDSRERINMKWGAWLLVIMLLLVDIQIFVNVVLDPFLKKKKGDTNVRYSIIGVILVCSITLYLLISLILRIMGKMPDL